MKIELPIVNCVIVIRTTLSKLAISCRGGLLFSLVNLFVFGAIVFAIDSPTGKSKNPELRENNDFLEASEGTGVFRSSKILGGFEQVDELSAAPSLGVLTFGASKDSDGNLVLGTWLEVLDLALGPGKEQPSRILLHSVEMPSGFRRGDVAVVSTENGSLFVSVQDEEIALVTEKLEVSYLGINDLNIYTSKDAEYSFSKLLGSYKNSVIVILEETGRPNQSRLLRIDLEEGDTEVLGTGSWSHFGNIVYDEDAAILYVGSLRKSTDGSALPPLEKGEHLANYTDFSWRFGVLRSGSREDRRIVARPANQAGTTKTLSKGRRAQWGADGNVYFLSGPGILWKMNPRTSVREVIVVGTGTAERGMIPNLRFSKCRRFFAVVRLGEKGDSRELLVFDVEERKFVMIDVRGVCGRFDWMDRNCSGNGNREKMDLR